LSEEEDGLSDEDDGEVEKGTASEEIEDETAEEDKIEETADEEVEGIDSEDEDDGELEYDVASMAAHT